MPRVFPTNDAAWRQQKQAIEDRIRAHQAELEVADTLEGVRFIQGQIATLRWLLDDVEPPVRGGSGKATYA